MAFGLFCDGCLEGTSGVMPAQDGLTRWGEWGQPEVERSARSLLKNSSFAAHLNHAGRLRLWRLQDEIARARTKDSFGLLWDKRHWDTDLLVRLAMKDEKATAVVMFIDVDDFKAVNTKAGYLVGDEVLRIVFQTVLTLVTGIGEAYRWGGDEITALLPDANAEVGERIGRASRDEAAKQCGSHATLRTVELKTTVSVGVGAFTGRPSAAEITTQVSELMKTKVKAKGKNSVVAETLAFPGVI
jgi:diguanylate cyclase (GGDEF)-like protein